MEQSLIIIQVITTIITTLATVATLIVVIIYTVYTAKMTAAAKASADAAKQTINEMKEAREQENAPYVVLYIDMNINPNLAFLVIKNVGKTIATNIQMKFTPPLESVVAKKINEIPLIKNGIPSLPPNYEIKTLFDGVIQRFGNTNLPLTYTVEISYSYGESQKSRGNSTQILDLSMYLDTIPLRQKNTDDLAKAFEEVAKNTKEIYSGINTLSSNLKKGIWIKNPLLPFEGNTPGTNSWYTILFAKLKEFQILWQVENSNEDLKQLPSYPSSLQAKALLISGQLLIILSACPVHFSEEHKNAIRDIATRLSILGDQQFYSSQLESQFDTHGSDIVKTIEALLNHTDLINFSEIANKEIFD